MRNQTLTFAIDALAVYRLTKLITEDRLTEDLRNLMRKKFPPTQSTIGFKQSLPEYFVNCPWCISVWAAAFVFTLRKISPESADYLSSILAASAVTGISVSKGI